MRSEARSGGGNGLGARDLLAVGTVWLRSRFLRASLAIAGITVSIATVVLVTSIPAAAQAALERQLTELGSSVLKIDPVQSGDELQTLPVSALPMIQRIRAVEHAGVGANLHEEVRRNAQIVSADGALTAMAVDGDLLGIVKATFRAGELPEGLSPSVVLGSDAAARLGITRVDPEIPITIDIGGVAFAVTGVLRPTPLAGDLQSAVFLRWNVAERWLGFDGRPTFAYANVMERSLEAARPVLAASLSPESPGSVQVSQPSSLLSAKKSSRATFDGLFLAMAAVSLVVGGIGIANTMLASVLERRGDIGLRRALGARRSDISLQFLIEALALCAIGGLLGVVLGAGFSAVWSLAQNWPVVIAPLAVGGGFVAALVTGAVAGLGPSLRASRMDPASALAQT